MKGKELKNWFATMLMGYIVAHPEEREDLAIMGRMVDKICNWWDAGKEDESSTSQEETEAPETKKVHHLFEVEAFFQKSTTHVHLMDHKKITVHRHPTTFEFVIEVE